MDTDSKEEVVEETEFTRWVRRQRKGGLLLELDQGIKELVSEVQRLGKAGSLTMTVKVEPSGRTVLVADEVKFKLPQERREIEVFYTDVEGKLHRTDPYEPGFLTSTGKVAAEFIAESGAVKKVDPETGEVHTVTGGEAATTEGDKQ